MPRLSRSTGLPRRALPRSLAAAALLVLAPVEASAHFVLQEPASWRDQDALGSPQKTGPCGDEGTAATTGAVTAYRQGDTVTITIDETITHPGHYRVVLAVNDRGELPAPPAVTPDDVSACGSAEIQDPPVFPVLADGLLVHEAAFDGPQTVTVTLPDDVTCEKCTLQVIEFMSDHAAPCFYYHCADISIGDGAPGAGGAGGQPGGGTGGGGTGGSGPGGTGGSSAGGAGGAGGGAGGSQAGASGNPADDSSSDDGCAAAAPRAAPPGLAALGGLLAAAALLRRRSARP
ncbi:MAG TPA: SCE4755 family polysaccharide monooxygenase-like protein [Polyangiaceae bacterium]|nr:SCE4755 family polysaccharide monooxygenase-like protein [Polyangiaceae bacterium]